MATPRARNSAAIVALAGAAAVHAQPGPSFFYSFSGVPVVASPGETFTVTVLCEFSPGVGQPVSLGPFVGQAVGLGEGGFSIAGSGGSWSELALIPPLNFPFGTSAGVAAGGSVNGVVYSLGFAPPAVPSTVNPAPVWRGTFTMPEQSVSLELTPGAPFGHSVCGLRFGGSLPYVFGYGPATGAAVTVLVPSPASAGLLALCVTAGTRRRRR